MDTYTETFYFTRNDDCNAEQVRTLEAQINTRFSTEITLKLVEEAHAVRLELCTALDIPFCDIHLDYDEVNTVQELLNLIQTLSQKIRQIKRPQN